MYKPGALSVKTVDPTAMEAKQLPVSPVDSWYVSLKIKSKPEREVKSSVYNSNR